MTTDHTHDGRRFGNVPIHDSSGSIPPELFDEIVQNIHRIAVKTAGYKGLTPANHDPLNRYRDSSGAISHEAMDKDLRQMNEALTNAEHKAAQTLPDLGHLAAAYDESQRQHPGQSALLTTTGDLIEYDAEWCELCAPEDEPFDEEDSPGLPRDVVDVELVETGLDDDARDAGLIRGETYEVAHLSCGHTVATAV